MSGKKLTFLLLMLLIAITGVVLAKDSGNSLGYKIAKDSSGSIKLKITTDLAANGKFLGVTLYPPNAKIGQSQQFAIKQGKNTYEIGISPSLINGTFEAAIWSRKLSSLECEKYDDVCQKNGYKLIGMVSYLWGYLTAQ